MMTILRKPIGEICHQDLDELCATEARETSELEFKGALPFQPTKGQPETADRWITKGDRVGDYARDRLLAELVAFANAEGGTLVLGIEETDDEPRRARSLAPLPRCEDLAKRLADASEDAIEPRLPIVEARALPLADGSGAGFVIFRVGRSASGPHRLVSDGQFYIRRGERSTRMTMREIRDSVLQLARRGDIVEEVFSGRYEGDGQAISRVWSDRTSDESHVALMRFTAMPVSRWAISNLTEQRNLWWTGGTHQLTLDGRILPGSYPAGEFDNPPRMGLRKLHNQEGHFERSLTADGLVEARVVYTRGPRESRVLDNFAPLYLTIMVNLVAGLLAQIEHLRRTLADDGAEFGIQLAIDSNVPLAPAWQEHGGYNLRPTNFRGVVFPILSVGPAAGFTDLVNLIIRDVYNHCDSAFTSRVGIDWARLIR